MLTQEVVILIAEDDEGHASLIKKNLKRSGISNQIIRFKNGQETLDFLFQEGRLHRRVQDSKFVLLLDIHMPLVDGVQVLRQIKEDPELAKIPVTMLTTTDDPREVKECFRLGCNNYIAKPVDYDKFVDVIKQLGLFLMVVEVPEIKTV